MQSIIKRVAFLNILILLLLTLAHAQQANPLVITIDTKDKAQVIQNIGVSGCWYSEPVGKYWPAEKKQRIAELLFSKKMDNAGNPAGIGVSAFRFNVGAGTAETGIAGGIADPTHRAECFLNADGSYDWHRQSGYQWFLQKAKAYGVENLLIFSNSPPVQFTLNGFGFKTKKDSLANLKPENYSLYAGFLATVIEHFDGQGLHFNYVSPVNEPQWDWTGKIGDAKQEGTPWTNREIYKVVQSLDSALRSKKLKTRITVAEAGMLTYLYGEKTAASRQIQNFFSDTSSMSFTRLSMVPHLLVGHSYFTDSNDSSLVAIRKRVADTAKKYKVEFWQSEYCMLGNGYKGGLAGSRTPMDCALFLAKVIHNDLAVANATAWHFWNAYEPGDAERENRYYLIALKPDSGFVNGSFTATKNLWSLGQYSLFIRPGMQRLNIKRSDHLNDTEAAQKTMISAYINHENRIVVVAINYTNGPQTMKLDLQNGHSMKSISSYVTTAARDDNMRFAPLQTLDALVLPGRSITTFVIE